MHDGPPPDNAGVSISDSSLPQPSGSLFAVSGATIFNDNKDPQALRTIGEVANALGIRPHVLRYWEEQFPGLSPIKRSGSRRYYRPEDVALIVEIDRLVHHQGYTLRGAAKVISEMPSARAENTTPTSAVGSIDPDFRQKLVAIRHELAEALAQA